MLTKEKEFELKTAITLSISLMALNILLISMVVTSIPHTLPPTTFWVLKWLETYFQYLFLVPMCFFVLSAYTAWVELQDGRKSPAEIEHVEPKTPPSSKKGHKR